MSDTHPGGQAAASASSKPNVEPDLHGVISALYVYPVKSCAGVEVREAILTETGLEFDRAWMVVDEQLNYLTQRELPRMALITPQLRLDDMVLRAPGMLALHVALDQVEEPMKVTIWGEEVAAYDMGPIASQWFSDFLGAQVRLVRFDPEHQRMSNKKWTAGIEALNQFNDGYPLLAISEASLVLLNDKLLAKGEQAVPMTRFRPNIVLGDAEGSTTTWAAHDEDRVGEIHVQTEQGVVQLLPVKPCSRCSIVNVDPADASSSPEVQDLLQSYRADARLDGGISFGMNLITLHGIDHVLQRGQLLSANFRFE